LKAFFVQPKLAFGSKVNKRRHVVQLRALGITHVVDLRGYHSKKLHSFKSVWLGFRDDGKPRPRWFWAHYRITSVTGLGNPSGTEGSTIQACRVTWPELKDIQPPTDSPGLVALAVAYAKVNSALQQWNINRERRRQEEQRRS